MNLLQSPFQVPLRVSIQVRVNAVAVESLSCV